jgi:CheY-like chemotaxis protein
MPISRRRILVVDDNQDSTDTLTRLLLFLGHDVRAAMTGPQALAVAEEFDPEVILLDIGLPEMDGYEVARRLRRQERFEHTVLVAVTGYGSPEDRRRSQQSGFNAHLVKPVELEALTELLAHPELLNSSLQNS